jgi:hypothetical protein
MERAMTSGGLQLTSDEADRADLIVAQFKEVLDGVPKDTSQLVVLAALANFTTVALLALAGDKEEAKKLLTEFASCVGEMITKAQRPS